MAEVEEQGNRVVEYDISVVVTHIQEIFIYGVEWVTQQTDNHKSTYNFHLPEFYIVFSFRIVFM